MSKLYKYFFFLLFFMITVSCSKDETTESDEAKNLADYVLKNNITTQPRPSGLYYIETLAGTGAQPTSGQTVYVHYVGKLLNGTKFDSSYDRGQPFAFVLGAGRVIAGWDEGIALMKKGGKATLIIPSNLAYGSNQTGSIPANSTLVFDVELVNIISK